MPVCRHCSQPVEERRALCPHCYGLMDAAAPPSRRGPMLFALLVLVVAAALVVRLLVQWT